MTFGDLFGGSDSEEDAGPVPSSGSRDRPPAEPRAKPKPKLPPSKPPEGAKSTLFDPFRFPDGRPVRMEYVLFGIRRDHCDPQTLHLNFGTTIRSNSARMTLLGGTVLLSSMRNVCAGTKGCGSGYASNV